ncbi:hypothetical protein [Capybara microvirus Cap3_SP_386]|nr:hypothetical protein [Capybara microvirus Cap3_SP_386]
MYNFIKKRPLEQYESPVITIQDFSTVPDENGNKVAVFSPSTPKIDKDSDYRLMLVGNLIKSGINPVSGIFVNPLNRLSVDSIAQDYITSLNQSINETL